MTSLDVLTPLDNVEHTLTVVTPSLDIFLSKYEPFSKFLTEIACLVTKCLNRPHTYQFVMSLKLEFESI